MYWLPARVSVSFPTALPCRRMLFSLGTNIPTHILVVLLIFMILPHLRMLPCYCGGPYNRPMSLNRLEGFGRSKRNFHRPLVGQFQMMGLVYSSLEFVWNDGVENNRVAVKGVVVEVDPILSMALSSFLYFRSALRVFFLPSCKTTRSVSPLKYLTSYWMIWSYL